MLTSSTVIFSIGSGERKRCSNMAPVRRLRSLAWMKARRLPGVRCSTLKTECRSLLCLMIMPGRSCVAGIDIGQDSPCTIAVEAGGRRGEPQVPPPQGLKRYFTRRCFGKETRTKSEIHQPRRTLRFTKEKHISPSFVYLRVLRGECSFALLLNFRGPVQDHRQ